MIKTLTLQQFRKYSKQTFQFDKRFVIIHAPNARGKTTILEAINYLTNATSDWTSDLADLYMIEDSTAEFFRIEAEIELEEENHNYAIYQSPKEKSYLINGHRTTRKKYAENLASTVFSPEHIELLMISPQKRRDYLDNVISKIDLDYADQIALLRKVLRQRNAHLKKLAKSFYETGIVPAKDQQLTYWSQKLVEISAPIMIKRDRIISRLINDKFKVVYQPSLKVNEFEIMQEATQLAQLHLQALEANMKREVAMGHTLIGPHRDDWGIFNGKEIKRFGSRGEKRMAIGELIFLCQELFAKELGFYPILLLDDITSELDTENSQRILTDEIMEKQQVFVTTVTLEGFPEELLNNSQIIKLE
ncbi:MAG: DNA replication/repair protein RecF [Candidatus Dojkabacteria bacterium]